jgi:hypothetical protein
MGVAMESANKAPVVHLTGLLSKRTVVEGGLETTTDVISYSQVFTENIQHLSDDHKRVFRSNR